jgi:hypothetical protein
LFIYENWPRTQFVCLYQFMHKNQTIKGLARKMRRLLKRQREVSAVCSSRFPFVGCSLRVEHQSVGMESLHGLCRQHCLGSGGRSSTGRCWLWSGRLKREELFNPIASELEPCQTRPHPPTL